ncbi:high light inducible protein [Prochlorococcus marinus str. MU1402]|uniref:chlorophyll a/b-binding protein n=1 Tax=Prochlorococcus marinus TaxID=1219 RepID=UPI001ADB68A1|nr:chlorophyll a/b-binding protein [Prochlorococcus marinus]MBO8231086.1 high light inducible protein [Prochlorococcus marinus XMU1402]MBW3055850.1 high light inducible protein [Prochlorococcus marinus str. MU1402]
MKTGEDRDEFKNISVDNELEGSDLKTEEKIDQVIDEDTEMYNFGWSNYSEITNGRFAMIGFLAIILIELLSQQSFLKWAGIL